jgi:hypothetical protein
MIGVVAGIGKLNCGFYRGLLRLWETRQRHTMLAFAGPLGDIASFPFSLRGIPRLILEAT